MSGYANRFTNLEPLGHGSYGYVYRALDSQTSEYIALKKIQINLEAVGIPPSVLREVSILQELRHPNIVRLQDVVPRETGVFLIFECLSSDLQRRLEDASYQVNVPQVMHDILKGLYHCHRKRFMHRDIKPSNVLIGHDGTAKLADFGLARSLQFSSRPYTAEVQTLWYRAPEVLVGAERYDLAIDVWSAGCIFAEMISGRALFQGANPLSQWTEICKIRGTPTEEEWPGITQITGGH